jgi:hypothetical protein
MESEREGKMDTQTMMEEYKKLATPGEPHRLLSRLVGSWDTRTKSWEEPDQPPKESKGTAELKTILGGRFLQQEISGEMMGAPFNGIEITGYDNNTKKFVSVWLDSMGTGIMLLQGTASPDGKTITQMSHFDDPIQGPMDLRFVTSVIDDNTLGFEMHGTDKSGKESKWMEMVYTRRQ